MFYIENDELTNVHLTFEVKLVATSPDLYHYDHCKYEEYKQWNLLQIVDEIQTIHRFPSEHFILVLFRYGKRDYHIIKHLTRRPIRLE